MRGVVLYAAVTIPFLVIPAALVPFGFPPDAWLSISVLTAIVVATYATWDIRRLYLASKEPRSIFWGMLVSAVEVKVAFGSWIGYLLAASLLARPEVGIVVPLPPQPVRAFVTGVAAVVLLTAAIYYAVTIRLERRRQATGP